jgi:hypothetical protein
MGDAPTPLSVLPVNKTDGNMVPAATIMDYKPVVNIAPFGTCKTLTSAASGVPTPCVPATVAPWTPGASKTLINNFPALTDSCKLSCTVGGMISISDPGQTKIDVT